MNIEFTARMKDLLGDEYAEYESSFAEPAVRGIRINTLKRPNEKISGICLSQSPFARNGWILDPACSVGNTPEYLCGHVYPQEPSASFAVTALDPRPGMRVLDLCAAPGSKSTQIAECLQNEGLLVANEINTPRARILKENLERCGCANAIILNNRPTELADVFGEFFDAVLCDAPCSGEGMFRKEPDAENQWSVNHVLACAQRQRLILEDAARCLKPGGILVYSTCTFSPEENEQNIAAFVAGHPEFEVIPIAASGGRNGIDLGFNTALTRRIYPMDGGEGHFVAKLRKKGESTETGYSLLHSQPPVKEALEFLNTHLERPFPYLYVRNDTVYGGTHPFIDCRGLHLIRHQIMLGTVKNRRFEPSHALAMSAWGELNPCFEMTEEQFDAYRRGETLRGNAEKGWMAAGIRGMRAGLVKSDGQILKNHYPKAFRIR